MPASNAVAPESSIKLLERLAYQVNFTLHSQQPESIHDLRVAVRRFQQSLAIFKRHFPSQPVRKIKRRLKELMDLASPVRDSDIAIRILTRSELSSARPVKEKVIAKRKEELAQLVAGLRRWSARNWSSKWRAALAVGPARGDHAAIDRLPRMARDFFEGGDRVSQRKLSAAEVHQYRIAVKKFRYTLEMFRPVYGTPVKQWLERLKSVQSLLGDVHDYHMVRLLAAGLHGEVELVDWLRMRQRKKMREFRKTWDDQFAPAATRRSWTAALRPPRKPMARSTAAGRGAAALQA